MKKILLAQFDIHHCLYNNVLDGFTDEETNRRLHEDKKMNHVKWLAGHILNSQYGLALLGGVTPGVKWDELFSGLGQSEARDDIPYPDIEEIKSEWNRLHILIRNGLEKRTPEVLNSKPPKPMQTAIENSPLDGVFDNTVAGLWAFLNHHQAYHIGQIGILRRGFGKEPMRYD